MNRKIHFRNTYGRIACKALGQEYHINTWDPFQRRQIQGTWDPVKRRHIVGILQIPKGIISSNRWRDVTCKVCKSRRGWGGDHLKKAVFVRINPDDDVDYIEIQSDLFRESGVNTSTSDKLINDYFFIMKSTRDWGPFPPISGIIQTITRDDIEDFLEAEEEGYAQELAWSRRLSIDDIGLEYVAIEDGHNRAYAAHKLGIPIRVRIWS